MELIGDEKRIQALFKQLRVEDERVAPRFGRLVNRAELIQPHYRFNLALAGTAALICAVAAFAWWSTARNRQPAWSPVSTINQSIANNSVAVPPAPPENTVAIVRPSSAPKRNFSKSSHEQLLAKRLTARRHAEILAANQKVIDEAKTISTWKSPTSSLLSSSSEEVLTSLPQFNQSANQLKSFLPGSSN